MRGRPQVFFPAGKNPIHRATPLETATTEPPQPNRRTEKQTLIMSQQSLAGLDRRRKQLHYRANHRGIKEMDIILGGFADDCIAGLSEAELDWFEALLEESDRDLFSWFLNEKPVPERLQGALWDAINAHQQGSAGEAK